MLQQYGNGQESSDRQESPHRQEDENGQKALDAFRNITSRIALLEAAVAMFADTQSQMVQTLRQLLQRGQKHDETETSNVAQVVEVPLRQDDTSTDRDSAE